jgi:hypothetical protein
LIDVYATAADEEAEAIRVRAFECFTPADLPAGIARGPLNECSVTPLRLAAWHDLTPVRGYALFRRRRSLRNLRGRPVWIGHWWAVTPAGQVIDASCAEAGLAYVGERR